jgi:hypothetical protein
MTRCINDIDTVIVAVHFPENSGSSRSDGNATLLFLDHPVHGSRTIMDLSYLMVYTGIIQYTLRRRGFTRVDVRHDTNVPYMCQIK